ncbi:DUF4855 domain-containing protein [Methanocaldococcus sp.]
MGSFALWYFGYDYKYEKRFNGNVNDLLNRNFNYAIALEVSEGKDIPQSGSLYIDGYNDGKELGKWIDHHLRGIDYFVAIPYYKEGCSNRGERRGLDYWKGYIDGVYDNTSGYQIGFYWNLESCGQVKWGYITDYELNELSNYIRNERYQQFIWIPSLGGRTIQQLEDSGVKNTMKYFNYVFCQPNYYQRNTMQDGSEYTYNKLVEILNWIWEASWNSYIELEADNQVLSNYNKVLRACEYVNAQKDSVVGDIWPQRAYYFDTEKEVIDRVRYTCPEW